MHLLQVYDQYLIWTETLHFENQHVSWLETKSVEIKTILYSEMNIW